MTNRTLWMVTGVILFILLCVSLPTVFGLSVVDVAPAGFTFVPPADVSRESASRALESSRAVIDNLKDRGFSAVLVDDAYKESLREFDSGNLLRVIELNALIIYVHDLAVDIHDELELLDREMNLSLSEGIPLGEAPALYNDASDAFAHGRYDEARERIGSARISLDAARAEQGRLSLIRYLSKNIFYRYAWYIIILVFLAMIFIYPVLRYTQRFYLRWKLWRMKEHLIDIQNIIKQMQTSCFVEKRMALATYKKNVVFYEQKMADIRKAIPVIEAQIKTDVITAKKPEERNIPGIFVVKK